MKRSAITLLLITYSLVCLSQHKQSPIDHAKNQVRKYLQKTLNDIKSYQSVNWYGFRKVTPDFMQSEQGVSLDRHFNYWLNLGNGLDSKIQVLKNDKSVDFGTDPTVKLYLDSIKVAVKEAQGFNTLIKSYEKIYNRDSCYFEISHRFRSKNGFGAIILSDYTFTLNKDFKVTDAYDNLRNIPDL